MNVNITPEAMDQIDKICSENNGKYVRLAILSGGCQGFSKIFDIVDTIEADDVVFDCYSGKLLIDMVSINFLDNSTVDYKNDLVGSFFSVDIPGSSGCGCGTSFSI